MLKSVSPVSSTYFGLSQQIFWPGNIKRQPKVNLEMFLSGLFNGEKHLLGSFLK